MRPNFSKPYKIEQTSSRACEIIFKGPEEAVKAIKTGVTDPVLKQLLLMEIRMKQK